MEATLVTKRARYYGSAEKSHFTSCFAVFFSATLCSAIFFSAESINYGHSALHGHWATFSSAEMLALKSANLCHLSPFFQR